MSLQRSTGEDTQDERASKVYTLALAFSHFIRSPPEPRADMLSLPPLQFTVQPIWSSDAYGASRGQGQ